MSDMNALREHIPEYAMTELAEGIRLASTAVNVPISDDLEFDHAAVVLRNIRRAHQRLEEQKRGLTAKWAQPKKMVDDHYRPVLEALENVDAVFADSLGRYHGKQLSRTQRTEGRALSKADDRRGRLLQAADRELEKADAHALVGSTDRSLAAIHKAEVAIDDAAELVAPIEEVHRAEGLGFTRRIVAKIVDPDAAVAFMMARHEFRKCVAFDLGRILEIYKQSHESQKMDGVEFLDQHRPIVQGGDE